MKGSTCFSLASLLAMSMSSLSCSSPAATPPAAICTQLTGYAASSMAMYSFATDIAPILSNQTSCAAATVCHGNPPAFLDTHGKTLSFVGTPATVKAALLGPSINAPSMKIVVPGNVGTSFLAYKVSGKDALGCVASNCVANATTGTSSPQITPCGDPMPALMLGTLADADKTKILDWIAQGAKD
jgi:hypothetical protein